jgi:hypothetical protein
MFGLSLTASLVVITQLWQRLVRHSVGPAAMVPTLWIVLGPLGQSITAVNLLGGVAHLALPPPYSTAFAALGVVYGIPVWGFALLWGTLAAALTVRAARQRLPFSLTWWSFTFPVGTCVTAVSGLALHTGAVAFRWTAAALYLALFAAWVIVAARTAHGAWQGRLFLPLQQEMALPSPAGNRLKGRCVMLGSPARFAPGKTLRGRCGASLLTGNQRLEIPPGMTAAGRDPQAHTRRQADGESGQRIDDGGT